MFTFGSSNVCFIVMTESAPRAQRQDGLDTADRILDAAEKLFVEHGFAATSMRSITTAASVNLAAANYHFGSKKGLFAAVIHRRVEPINNKRLLLLEELIKSERKLTVRSILEVFFQPVADTIAMGLPVPRLIGRMYGEPESLVRPILESEFGEVATRFQEALSVAMPTLPKEELRFRFHFMIGSMIHLLQIPTPLGTESNPDLFSEAIEQLIDFAEAGLRQPVKEHSP